MKALPRTETSFAQELLNWAAERISRVLATIRPEHSAAQVAVRVAASGNPSGMRRPSRKRPREEIITALWVDRFRPTCVSIR